MSASALTKTDWKLKENGSAHHTSQFSGQELVVRRGQTFSIGMHFSGARPAEDSLKFTIETGSTPNARAIARKAFGISSTPPSKGSWGATLTAADSSALSVSISSPANAIIGRYQLSLAISSGTSVAVGSYVLLFNPWVKEDEVFMANDAEREEYVMSEFSIVFVGNTYRISPVGWDVGQFQEDILDTCLALLDRSLSKRQDPVADINRRHDPKYVSRVLSAMVNSNDDSGVLLGNWSGNYSGGASPSSWTGSVDILRKWKEAFKPVRYGQCWVFAGVLTTVLRCLGIPTRMISNFNSAHDTDRNLFVDVFYDASGNPLNIASDSVWNFHVWNEGWFARPDIGAAFNGWQILDATPQERSAGIFQCGPASLTAIKEGDVNKDYDCPFVFAEVNADRVTWLYTSTGEKQRLHSETKSIGQFTSTKAVGSNARVDVTSNYKYAEGTVKEREVFKKARTILHLNTLSATSARPPEVPKPKVSGQFEVLSFPQVGQDVSLVLQLTNEEDVAKSLQANMTAWTIVYTGKPIQEVWKESVDVTLGPKEEKKLPITISYADYQQSLTPDNTIRATALCQLKKDSDVLVETDITLQNPGISIQVLGEAKVNQDVKVEVMFTNPLDDEVTGCVVLAEGSDLLPDRLKIEAPSLKAKERCRVQFEIKPSKGGTKQLLVNFSCDKFQDIKAFQSIKVAN